jgi:uncharacterized protein YndB with AHSA1/START domain
MTPQTDDTVVKLDIVVDASAEHAFRVFTEQFDRIKPRDHNLLAVPIAETVLEPEVGGYVFDRGEDGSVCRWARVLAFDPPERLVISWDISPRWQLETDPDHASEVEIRFVPLGPTQTRVELQHRHLDRHGPEWPGVRDSVGGEGGWPLYLRRYADLVTATAAS